MFAGGHGENRTLINGFGDRELTISRHVHERTSLYLHMDRGKSNISFIFCNKSQGILISSFA